MPEGVIYEVFKLSKIACYLTHSFVYAKPSLACYFLFDILFRKPKSAVRRNFLGANNFPLKIQTVFAILPR